MNKTSTTYATVGNIVNGIDLGECREEPTMDFVSKSPRCPGSFRFQAKNNDTFGNIAVRNGMKVAQSICDEIKSVCKSSSASELCEVKAIPAFKNSFDRAFIGDVSISDLVANIKASSSTATLKGKVFEYSCHFPFFCNSHYLFTVLSIL